MRRFDALSLSLAELVLNVLFAVLFLIGVDSALSGESTAAAPESRDALVEDLERERDALSSRLDVALAAEAQAEGRIDDSLAPTGGLSRLRPNCSEQLFEGTVLSATEVRIEAEVLPISELGERFPGTDRRTRAGCVHPVRVRFASMDGRSYERALRALENRYRVYREDTPSPEAP